MPPENTKNDVVDGERKSESDSDLDLELDVVIVGAGFSGITLLHMLRQRGYSVQILEAGSGLGGTWYWNCYPGARVDSDNNVYSLALPQVWRDWSWSEKYPGWRELQSYFAHIDSILNVSKDVHFNAKVVSCVFDEQTGRWTVRTANGGRVNAKYLLPCVGFAAKQHVPDWPGLPSFRGTLYHSASWPREGVSVRGRRTAIIGTGSTGVQIAQEWAKEADSLLLFQRTPNLCLPMRQQPTTTEEQRVRKAMYPFMLKVRQETFGGFAFDFVGHDVLQDTPEEREKFLEQLWEKGGFVFWIGTYRDIFFDSKGNRAVYDFWARKVRERIQDPRKRDILAPLEPPHPFGTKRPSLEQDFYEQFNKPNVDVISVRENAIADICPEGIVMADGTVHVVDVIAVATGFDAITGSMCEMGIERVDGTSLRDYWHDGVRTNLGIAVHGCPNMFFTYGPQAPTPFSNGPSCIDVQADWIVRVIDRLQAQEAKFVDATPQAEQEWRNKVLDMAEKSLFPEARSWYMGANIPGKNVELLAYIGGLGTYKQILNDTLIPSGDIKGFHVVHE